MLNTFYNEVDPVGNRKFLCCLSQFCRPYEGKRGRRKPVRNRSVLVLANNFGLHSIVFKGKLSSLNPRYFSDSIKMVLWWYSRISAITFHFTTKKTCNWLISTLYKSFIIFLRQSFFTVYVSKLRRRIFI